MPRLYDVAIRYVNNDTTLDIPIEWQSDHRPDPSELEAFRTDYPASIDDGDQAYPYDPDVSETRLIIHSAVVRERRLNRRGEPRGPWRIIGSLPLEQVVTFYPDEPAPQRY